MESDWTKHAEKIIQCRLCPRLVKWREQVAVEKRRAFRDWEYWGKPVTGFGDPQARLLVVGLAPGAHGSNRTGRMFTGDSSGNFLYAALFKAGFASQPASTRLGDGLTLRGLFISALCRCVPPDNKPLPEEMKACRPFLETEIDLLKPVKGIIALGRLAFDQSTALYRSRGAALPEMNFSHGAFYRLGEGYPWMLASYHPSRQNTQTGRLTAAMFDAIWHTASEYLEE